MTIATIRTGNRMAIFYMLAAAILFSFLPFTFSIGDAHNAPFLFNAVLQFSSAATCIIFLAGFNLPLFNRKTFALILANLRSRALFWATVGTFEYVFFAVSLNYIDVAVAAVLIQTWLIFMVLFTARLFEKEMRYHKISATIFFLLLLGFSGVAFVIFSQTEQLDNAIGTLLGSAAVFGIAAVLVAAVLAGLAGSFTLKWGSEASLQLSGNNDHQLFFTIAALAIVKIFGSAVAIVSSLSIGESINDISITLAFAYGFFGFGVAAILMRVANVKTTDLGVNAIAFVTPVFSLSWLGLGSLIHVPHVDLLIIGTVAIILANLLINFVAEIRLGYKALIIALWICCVSVYLLPGFPLTDYLSAVEVSSILFVLILSFRMDRLVRRTTEEERLTFSLCHRISALTANRKTDDQNGKAALDGLFDIDRHRTMDQLKTAYENIQNALQKIRHRADDQPGTCHEITTALHEVETDVETLVHSKQQGMNFGELTALALIGSVLVAVLLLFKPPELIGWSRFFIDISSFVLATVIVFLFVNLIDLQNDRILPVLKKENDHYALVFDDATNRGVERLISSVVCCAIIVAFVFLFAQKWL